MWRIVGDDLWVKVSFHIVLHVLPIAGAMCPNLKEHIKQCQKFPSAVGGHIKIICKSDLNLGCHGEPTRTLVP